MNIDEKITANIYGNKKKINNFIKLFNKKKEGDVWLIQGIKGIGKSKFILNLTRKLLDINNFDAKEIIDPDFHLIKQLDLNKKFIAVDNVRKINHFYSTTSNKERKITMIDSISELNIHGHNSILKILENHPINSNIFLIDHLSHPFPATIRSRCKILRLDPLKESEVYKVLEKILTNQKKETLNFYTKLSNGSPGKALELYEYNGKKVLEIICEFIVNIKTFNINVLDKLYASTKDNFHKSSFINIFFMLITMVLTKAIKVKSQLLINFLDINEERAVNKLSNEVCLEKLFSAIEYAQELNSDMNAYNLDIKNCIYTSLIKLKKIF